MNKTVTEQIITLANDLAHVRFIGRKPGTPVELSEVNIQSLIILSAMLDVLTEDQRKKVLETLQNL